MSLYPFSVFNEPKDNDQITAILVYIDINPFLLKRLEF